MGSKPRSSSAPHCCIAESFSAASRSMGLFLERLGNWRDNVRMCMGQNRQSPMWMHHWCAVGSSPAEVTLINSDSRASCLQKCRTVSNTVLYTTLLSTYSFATSSDVMAARSRRSESTSAIWASSLDSKPFFQPLHIWEAGTLANFSGSWQR
jgi:hypothetical protein